MQNDAKLIYSPDVCNLVMKEKGKPEGYLMCKAMCLITSTALIYIVSAS
jgi:hypothetical protein